MAAYPLAQQLRLWIYSALLIWGVLMIWYGDRHDGTGAVLAFSADEIAPSRVSQKFADANEQMKILGGIMNGKALSTAEIKTISQLPSLDGIRGKLIGLLQAPGGQLARVTKAYSEKEQAAA